MPADQPISVTGYANTEGFQIVYSEEGVAPDPQYYLNDSVSVTGPSGAIGQVPNTSQASDTETDVNQADATTVDALLNAYNSSPQTYTIPLSSALGINATSPGAASTDVPSYSYAALQASSLSLEVQGVGNASVADSTGSWLSKDQEGIVGSRTVATSSESITADNVILRSSTIAIDLNGSLQLSTTPEDPSAYQDGELPHTGAPDKPNIGAGFAISVTISNGSYSGTFGLRTFGAQYQYVDIFDADGNQIASVNYSGGGFALGSYAFTMTGLPVGV